MSPETTAPSTIPPATSIGWWYPAPTSADPINSANGAAIHPQRRSRATRLAAAAEAKLSCPLGNSRCPGQTWKCFPDSASTTVTPIPITLASSHQPTFTLTPSARTQRRSTNGAPRIKITNAGLIPLASIRAIPTTSNEEPISPSYHGISSIDRRLCASRLRPPTHRVI